MSEIISKWFQHRLGLVIDMTPENFALRTANGCLLALLLHSYQIIKQEQLMLIVDTDQIKQCYENLKNMKTWLKPLNISLEDDDIYEIAHAVGTASMHLFYQIYLELQDKTTLDIIAENEIKNILGTKVSRFHVQKVKTDESSDINLHSKDLCQPILAGGDVIHWYKDRMEALQNKIKEAREEYIHVIKNRCISCGIDHLPNIHDSNFIARSFIANSKNAPYQETSIFPDDSGPIDEKTYEELKLKEKQARELKPFVPNKKETTNMLNQIKIKNKIRKENNILKNELHREIMNEFNRKIEQGKSRSEDRVLTNIFARQSQFEKQLISKMGQIKMQKHFMIENKIVQGQKLNKLKENEFASALLLKDKDLDEKKITYYLERERTLELHKKIWAERHRLKKERRTEECYNALNDMVNMAIYMGEYKKIYNRNLTEREKDELKKMFVSGQPIFDIVRPVSRIIHEQEELPEELVFKEINRQDAVDQEELDSYIHFTYPWELKNIDNCAEILQQVGCGLNVLGCLVHRTLSTKYPLAPLPEKPQFPEAKIRVCINGLNDLSVIPILKNLLSEREILVVQLQDVVDYCLQALHNETEIGDSEDNERKTHKAKPERPPKKGKKLKTQKKGPEPIGKEDEDLIKVFENKSAQTPGVFPGEEIPLSPIATLGKAAQETLSSGEPLTDFLLIAMFVEYLKSIPNLKGWVLVNFPTEMKQAAILEEAFTGICILEPSKRYVDDKSLYDLVDVEEKSDTNDLNIYEKHNKFRRSALLPNPVTINETVKVYDSILTAYIKIKKMDPNSQSGNASLPPVFEELENETDPMDKFYADTGVNYSMYYKDFDMTTIKYLGKLIIGDYSLPLKSSIELFGDVNFSGDWNSQLKTAKGIKKGEKIAKPKERIIKVPTTQVSEKSKSKEKEKKESKKGGKLKVVITREDKSVQVPDDYDELELVFVSEESIVLPKAGEEGWEYSDITCPEDLQLALATLWENLEETYINDLKEIFFLKRVKLSTIMPFVQYVKNNMKKVIDRPDWKAYYVSRFQKAFNEFDPDFRRDDEFKVEMHCRIKDFKERLLEFCDADVIESENARSRIISENWAPLQLCELLNDYANMFQIEMDRCVESIRFIDNYYMGIFTNLSNDLETFKECVLAKFVNIDNEAINLMFRSIEEVIDLSYFENVLDKMTEKATVCIRKYTSESLNNLEKIKLLTSSNNKSKIASVSSKSGASEKKTTVIDETIKQNSSKLLEEWQCAINGENSRVNLRFGVIKNNALEVFQEFINSIRSAFHDVYYSIRSKYSKEVDIICKVTNIFQAAVENERPLKKELVFEGDKFYINPEVNLIENPVIIPAVEEETDAEVFSIKQLTDLANILLDLCPSGYMLKTSFTYILQDLIWNDTNDIAPGAPALWQKLNSSSLNICVNVLFDDLEYVYWKDFIIYNLRINYPTERELILTRKHLRDCDPDSTELVTEYQFLGTKLWFEWCFKGDLARSESIKKLLNKMYSVQDRGVNYTALLLDFCKDENCLIGFVKALELSLGQLVCWDKDIGNCFKEEHLKLNLEHEEQVRQRNMELETYYQAAYEEVCKLVDHVVHISEDVIVEDLVDETKKDPGNDLKTGSVEEIKSTTPCKDTCGTESMENSQMAFFLSFEVLVTVITTAIPWHCKVRETTDSCFWEQAAEIYEQCRNADFNDSVFAYEFLNSDNFLKLLATTKKFSAKDTVKIVKYILQDHK